MSTVTEFDITWERELLETCLAYPDDDHAIRAIATARPEWFMSKLNRRFWSLMLGVTKTHGCLDIVALFNAVNTCDAPDDERSAMRAMVYGGTVLGTGDCKHALARLRESYMRREMAKRLDRLARSLSDATENLDEMLPEVNDALTVLHQDTAGRDMEESTFENEVGLWLERQPQYADMSKMQMVRFGIPVLDEALIVGPGALVVMAAMTSAGKTSLAIQGLHQTLAAGFRPMIFSLEMDDAEISARLIASLSGVDSGQAMRGFGEAFIGSDKRRWIQEAAAKILKVTKVPGRRFEAVAAKIRECHRKHHVQVVFVDYFTLLNPPDLQRRTSASTAYLLGEMSKGFKALAVDLGIAIVLISQFSRKGSEGERPTLDWLKETSQLEQDANAVLMMWTEKATYGPDEDRVVLIEIQKNRGGRRWVNAKTKFNPGSGRFTPEQHNTQPVQLPEPSIGEDYL